MARVEIKCAENGPGIVTVDGVVFAAMCRCGGSKSKPYCDGTRKNRVQGRSQRYSGY